MLRSIWVFLRVWLSDESKLIRNIGKFVESFGYSETKPPITEIRVNDMYPYNFEQTVSVTHYNKPKRRDPARRMNRR